MKNILLITIDSITSTTIIEKNVDEKVLSKTLMIVQENYLKPIIGAGLYNTLLNEIEKSISGETIDQFYHELVKNAKSFLINKTVSEFLMVNQFKITNKGVMKMSDNSAVSVNLTDLESLKNYYDNLVTRSKIELINYLRSVNVTPADEIVTENATSLFLGTGKNCRKQNSDFVVPKPVPVTLQEVTSNGNRTTNNIVFDESFIQFKNNNQLLSLNVNALNNDRTVALQDKDGTVALISDIEEATSGITRSLQDVTDEGNETTNNIILKDSVLQFNNNDYALTLLTLPLTGNTGVFIPNRPGYLAIEHETDQKISNITWNDVISKDRETNVPPLLVETPLQYKFNNFIHTVVPSNVTGSTTTILPNKSGELALMSDVTGATQNLARGTVGQIPFIKTGGGDFDYSSGITWDNTNNLLSAPKIKIGSTVNTELNSTLNVSGNIQFDPVKDPTNGDAQGIVLSVNGSGNVPAGTWYYSFAYYTAEGDTTAPQGSNGAVNIVLTGSSKVLISNIPTSPDPRVIGRRIYRSQTGNVNDYYWMHKIADIGNNTVTTYIDNSSIDATRRDTAYNKSNTTSGAFYINNNRVGIIADYVTSFGQSAMKNITGASTSAAFGKSALFSLSTGLSNQAFGYGALVHLTTGSENVAMGYNAGYFVQSGGSSVFVGCNAGRCATFNNNSGVVAIGNNTGFGVLSSYGVFVGHNAGQQTTDRNVGNGNIVLGAYSGRALGTGQRNILLGYQIELSNPDLNNQLNIGNVIYATGTGVGSTPSVLGKVGIGTTTPSEALHVNGKIRVGAYTLPAVDGTAGQVLKTDGNGNLTWANP